MAFDENELEAAQILLRLLLLIHDSEIRSMFSLRWGSLKQRTMRKFDPLSGRKTPHSFPNLKIQVTLKRKRSENHQRNLSRLSGAKARSCSVAVKDESSKRRKVTRSSNSSAALLLPDLNLPPLIEEEEEEEHWHKQEAHKPTLHLSAC